ncbi:MAG: hypothetical protein KC516_01455 [Nanoarchaeota archaeon]|nr:hypothetical protein [Nanoarchaeota archaeon]
MAEDEKSGINGEMLNKYSWALLANKFYDNRQTDEAAWTLATFGREGIDLGLSAEAYKVGLKRAVEIFTEKYQSIIGDSTISDYAQALGVKDDLGEGANLKFSELGDKINDAKHTLNSSKSPTEEKLKAQEELSKYALYQEFVGASETSFTSSKRTKVEELRRNDLVQKVLDLSKS